MSAKFGRDDIGIKKLGEVADPKLIKESDWQKVLPSGAFEVTRKAGIITVYGTEPAYSGAFDKCFDKGRYVCLCCGAELFNSDSKYWSGCGWPAFSKSVDNDLNIVRIKDNSYGMNRVEVKCKKCDAHLGHVFDDGPKDTGERYCINSLSME
uniref:Peptide-methionine (R)-S-oxide reductase n=1 Tax=Heterorhabditis bacteriophora TaxID=37862 RepID=A0A1I7X2T6_HETBA